MSVGKYSPTVYELYGENENWFRENLENDNDLFDKDGYDSYGYDEEGFDRDGRDSYYYLAEEYHLNDPWDDPHWNTGSIID